MQKRKENDVEAGDIQGPRRLSTILWSSIPCIATVQGPSTRPQKIIGSNLGPSTAGFYRADSRE